MLGHEHRKVPAAVINAGVTRSVLKWLANRSGAFPTEVAVVPNFALMDFETAGPTNLKEAGAWRYSECPTTEILCLVFAYNGQAPLSWTPGEPTDYLRSLVSQPDIVWVHHGEFDIAIWRNIMVPVYGLPDIPNERWHDTMSACAVKALPLSVEDAAIALRLPIRKDIEGRKHTLSLSKFNKKGYYDRSPEAIQRTVEYCKSDCLAEQHLHARIGWMPADERDAYLQHQMMNQRGLRIDLDFVAKAQEIVDKASVPLLARFRELTGLNPTQIAKVRDWCEANGTDLPDLSAETVAEALGSSIDDEEDPGLDPTLSASLKPQVREALLIRQVIGSASVKKLGRMASCVCCDGRAA